MLDAEVVVEEKVLVAEVVAVEAVGGKVDVVVVKAVVEKGSSSKSSGKQQ